MKHSLIYIDNKSQEYLQKLNSKPIPSLGNMFRDTVHEIISSGFSENDFEEDANKFATQRLSKLYKSTSELSEYLDLKLKSI